MRPSITPRSLVAAYEAKTRFGDLLARVERGEIIVITRHGYPVARLVPFDESVDRERAQAAVERLAVFGEGADIRLPDDVTIEDLINEGRE
jgi:prevent-host-death family protein